MRKGDHEEGGRLVIDFDEMNGTTIFEKVIIFSLLRSIVCGLKSPLYFSEDLMV